MTHQQQSLPAHPASQTAANKPQIRSVPRPCPHQGTDHGEMVLHLQEIKIEEKSRRGGARCETGHLHEGLQCLQNTTKERGVEERQRQRHSDCKQTMAGILRNALLLFIIATAQT